jgi:hypothetical protein
MRITFTDLHDRHDCAGEMKDGQLAPCFENPRRLMAIADALRAAGRHEFETPPDMGVARGPPGQSVIPAKTQKITGHVID